MNSPIATYLIATIASLLAGAPHAAPAPTTELTTTTAHLLPTIGWLSIARTVDAPGDVLSVHRNSTEEECHCASWIEKSLSLPENLSNAGDCMCQCPAESPVYIGGKCVERLDECPNTVKFHSKEGNMAEKPAALPVLELMPSIIDFLMQHRMSPTNISAPLTPPGMAIMWKESSIRVKTGYGARCEIDQTLVLDVELQEWLPVKSNWFRLGWHEDGAKLLWNQAAVGANPLKELKQIRKLVNGSIVQLRLNCLSSGGQKPFCLAFRASGTVTNSNASKFITATTITTSPPRRYLSTTTSDEEEEYGRRIEVIIIILLTILLFLSLFGSIVLWSICWRMKKNELISSLQMQFLYHIKQEKEKATAEAAHLYNKAISQHFPPSYGPNEDYRHILSDDDVHYVHDDVKEDSQQGGEEITSARHSLQDYSQSARAVSTPKKRLFFSPEFFEPHLMANPPAVAEQFLHDLRRMITIAKQRIILRRHVSRLEIILEEAGEGGSSASASLQKEGESSIDVSNSDKEGSPKSSKSSDSGRGTSTRFEEGEESGSNSGKEETEEDMQPNSIAVGAVSKRKESPPHLLASDIKCPSEEAKNIQQHHSSTLGDKASFSSRIPVGIGSRSPRQQKAAKKLVLSPSSYGITSISPLPGSLTKKALQPQLHQLTPPPPLQHSSSFVSSSSSSTSTCPSASKKQQHSNNTYALFTSDSMLKKSLPRRPKRTVNAMNTGAISAPLRRRDLLQQQNRVAPASYYETNM